MAIASETQPQIKGSIKLTKEQKMLNRRHFLQIAVLTTTLSNLTLAMPKQRSKGPPLLKPLRLQAGDGVGLISPAGAIFLEEELEIVKEAMLALGLVPYVGESVLARYGYLAGSDVERAKDINKFFANSELKILLAVRGGWGCARLLPYLDYDLIRQNPKIIVGFSDITALLLAIYVKTNLITFHGPNAYSGWRTEQTDVFRRVLFSGETLTFQNERLAEDDNRLMQVKSRIRTITPGKAQGFLVGGNLSVLSAMLGSSYVPNWEGAILFVEDVGEYIYRIDRFLTHLKIAGVLEQLAGFIFGQCTNCSPGEGYGALTLEQVLGDHIKPLKIPAWSGAMIGHIENIWTLPIGLPVEINADAGTIQMLELAVV